MRRRLRVLPFVMAVLLAVLIPARASSQQADEAARVRVLLVLDTLDRGGQTWGLDGDNMKAMLERAFAGQNIDKNRVTVDMFTGAKVNPRTVLDYYDKLNVGPDEALVFFYSGHGGYHVFGGHYLALTLGPLYRDDLVKAMTKKNPRLVVLLTDCCANFHPRHIEPTNRQVVATNPGDKPGTGPAKREEPPVTVRTGTSKKPNPLLEGPPRPQLVFARKLPGKAKKEEPPFEAKVGTSKGKPPAPPARREEPPTGGSTGVLVRTPTGTVPFKQILDKTDGAMIRELFFRPKGLVDINGCRKGDMSMGQANWGGSFFTIGFLLLQNEDRAKLDANGNGVVEWSEFYPALRTMTEKVSRGTTKKVTQTPDAFQLNVGN
jgi:hypothetical protein